MRNIKKAGEKNYNLAKYQDFLDIDIQCPYKNLWFSVLFRAVLDLCLPLRKNKKFLIFNFIPKANAICFFASDSQEEKSLSWICEQLNLNLNEVKKVLNEKIKKARLELESCNRHLRFTIH